MSHESVYLVNNRDAEETTDIQNISNKNKPNCAEMRVFQIIFIFWKEKNRKFQTKNRQKNNNNVNYKYWSPIKSMNYEMILI